MNLLQYLVLIVILCLGGSTWYERHEATSARAELEAYKHGAEVAHGVSLALLEIAHHAHDAELADLRHYRDANPIGPVRLCSRPAAIPILPAPTTGSGPGTGPVQPVHAGDSGGGPGPAGPDIGGMLDAFAASCDAVSADLREQQAAR